VDVLDPAGRILREHFVTQYLVDFKAAPALRRAYAALGLDPPDANWVNNNAWQFLQEPFVAMEVQKAIDGIQEKNLVTRNRIIAGLVRESNFEGMGASHAARVSGWSKLANILKMDVKQIEANLASRGGILVVPVTQKPEDWEKRATEAQAALKAEVRK
jgi:hypothetical protein